MIAYLRDHGRPLAVYTDHAGHFGQWRSEKEERTETVISRGLGELGVEVILAGSPQAKGRIERSFGTAQDRLIKEMRVEGVSGTGGGEPVSGGAVDAVLERPVRGGASGERGCAPPAAGGRRPGGALRGDGDEDGGRKDFTVRFQNRWWQIPERDSGVAVPGTKVTVEVRLDESVRLRVGER